MLLSRRYEHEEWELKHFDQFCCEKGVSEPSLSRALVMEWGRLRENEYKTTSGSRFSVIRQFGLFLLSLDMEAYLPSNYSYRSKSKTHVLSDDEIIAVFRIIDQRHPVHSNSDFQRLSLEYRIILRLIYCCGLRISEARLLKNQDVDFESGTLRIKQSKGHKDRLVYFASDMKQLLLQYHSEIISQYQCQTVWFFPGRYPDRPLPIVTIDMVFRNAWNQTPFAATCDKAPTVHSLRHTFVVKRMNLWMEQGVSLKEMLPYAEAFLNNTITVEQLSRAMQLGKLGEQIVIKSRFAFSKVKYEGFEAAEKDMYYVLRKARDIEANQTYLDILVVCNI